MIGIDVGGANLKVVDGAGKVHIHYCPLWQDAPIAELLMPYNTLPDEPVAVVMSGELADCFRNKNEGIGFIVDEVRTAFPKALFYGTDARFHNGPAPQLAAANWLASADFLREKYPDAILLDIGSTTADIIPLPRFDRLLGLTDLKRLQAGYLRYTGMLRTNIATLLSEVVLDGIVTPVSTEYFASSADAHLVLDHISIADYSSDTADKKEKTLEASLRRLARVVCADLEETGTDGALQVARAFWEKQRNVILNQVIKVQNETGAERIIVAGIGSQLFAKELSAIDLTQELGHVADALPAFAVREILARETGVPE